MEVGLVLLPYLNARPRVHADAHVSPTAVLIGKVVVEGESSVWDRAVLRGDMGDILLGRQVHVLENCTVHVERDGPATLVGQIVVEAGAVVHASTVESQVLVGYGARLLSYSRIGSGSIVSPGALVPEGVAIPPRSLVAGVPARVQRETTEDEVQAIVRRVHELAQRARLLERR